MKKEDKLIIIAGIISSIILTSLLFNYYFNIYTVTINERMAITDRIGGNVWVYKNGNLMFNEHNNMTNAGDDAINDALFNWSYSWGGYNWTYIAIGTGNGAATNKTRTDLVTEIDRQNATYAKPADAQWELNYTFTFIASHTILEAGIFNNATSGVMLFYIWTLNIAVTSADTLLICWRGTTSGY